MPSGAFILAKLNSKVLVYYFSVFTDTLSLFVNVFTVTGQPDDIIGFTGQALFPIWTQRECTRYDCQRPFWLISASGYPSALNTCYCLDFSEKPLPVKC